MGGVERGFGCELPQIAPEKYGFRVLALWFVSINGLIAGGFGRELHLGFSRWFWALSRRLSGFSAASASGLFLVEFSLAQVFLATAFPANF